MSDIPLSLPRRFINDLLRTAQAVPLATAHRRLCLTGLVRARAQSPSRVGWCALFTKGFALVAARRPALRRVLVPFPRPRLYEHPHSIAAVSIERHVEDEPGVLFGNIRAPERQSLEEIDQHLKSFKESPLWNVGLYRRILRLSRFPQCLRRLAWWWGSQVSGSRKARHLGTFGVSVVSGQGAVSPHLLTPVTTSLNYGVIQPDGSVDAYLTFDQRVIDPAPAATAMAELEATLNEQVLLELPA